MTFSARSAPTGYVPATPDELDSEPGGRLSSVRPVRPTTNGDVNTDRRFVAHLARFTLGTAGLVVLGIIMGNLVILAASAWAQSTTPTPAAPALPGIAKLEAVDDHLWRGAAPSTEGYQALAEAGVRTVIDLRAEEGVEHDTTLVESLGMRAVRLPIRDGQAPDTSQVDTFLRLVAGSEGPVFVHCGAGVGRTSTMVGAWLVTDGQLNARGALRRNLAVGPPSLEQLAFVAQMTDDGYDEPGAVVTAISRVLDAPRRLWHLLGA